MVIPVVMVVIVVMMVVIVVMVVMVVMVVIVVMVVMVVMVVVMSVMVRTAWTGRCVPGRMRLRTPASPLFRLAKSGVAGMATVGVRGGGLSSPSSPASPPVPAAGWVGVRGTASVKWDGGGGRKGDEEMRRCVAGEARCAAARGASSVDRARLLLSRSSKGLGSRARCGCGNRGTGRSGREAKRAEGG